MPAKKVNNVTDVIWGNKLVEANARLLPPSRGPVSTDPEWNELVDTVQDPSLGHGHTGTAGDGKLISPGTLGAATNPHDDTEHTFPTGQTHTHAIGFSYSSARRTATQSITGTTFVDILTQTIPVPVNPFMVWAYVLCYVDVSTTIAALRLYDTAKGQLFISPHPDTEYQINNLDQISHCVMGRDQWSPPPISGTVALQGRVVSAGGTLTVLKAGLHGYTDNPTTA